MEKQVMTTEAQHRPATQPYYVELKATVSVVIWLDAESKEQARDIAAQWQPDGFGCHEVKEYFADSTDNGKYVELEKPIPLDWELEDTEVEEVTVEAVDKEPAATTD